MIFSLSKRFKQIVPAAVHPGAFARRYLNQIVSEGRVSAGLFEGMYYPPKSVCSQNIPKFLGAYELELLPIFERLRRINFPHIIDVGAAEGYYAMGCSLLWPKAQVTAYEQTDAGRELMAEYAHKNRVQERLKIYGRCSAEELAKQVKNMKSGLIIMDVEGAEAELLLGVDTRDLANFHMLVEIHDETSPRAADAIFKAFCSSHEIEFIQARPRMASDLKRPKNPLIRRLTAPYILCHLHERPLPMRWIYSAPITNTFVAVGEK